MKRLWAPVVLAVLVLAFFGHALFGDRILLQRDLFSFHYPMHHYWVERIRNGSFPGLNTSVNGGQPLFVDPNNSLLYPLSILYFFFDFDTAWNLTFAVHVLWAAWGLFYLSRVLGFSINASLCGAMTFAFGGPLLSSITYYAPLIGISWLPWILGLSFKAAGSGRRWVAIAALAFGAQLLDGEPTVIVGTVILLILLFFLILRQTGNVKATMLRGAAFLLIALLLACVQILPTLLWIPHSGRATQLDFYLSAAYWSLHPVRLLEFIVPHFFGNVMSDFARDYWGSPYADSGYPYIFMPYVGWLPLVLAPVAARNRWGIWALFVTAGFILLSFGRWLPGYRQLFDLVPFLQVIRYPEKFLILANFGLGVAVAAAVSVLPHLKFRQLIPSILLSACLISVIAIFVFHHWPEGLSDLQRGQQLRALFTAATTGLVAILLVLFISRHSRLVALLPLVLFLDASSFTWELLQTDSRSSFARMPALVKKIPELRRYPILHRGELQTDQYFSGGLAPGPYMKEAMHPLLGLNWGIQYGATRDIDRLWWRMSSIRQSWIQQRFPSNEALNLMRQCGIARVISLNPITHPELRLESHIELPGKKQIYVYRLDPPPPPFIRWKDGSGQIEYHIQRSDHISIVLKDAKAGTLIMSRNAIPGWSCAVDGNPMQCKSTTEGWLEIDVPTGNHHIEFAYATPGLFIGAVFTAVGTLLVAALLVFG